MLLDQPDEILQLLLRLDVEVADAGLNRLNDLFVGLPDARIDDLGGIAAGLQNAV